MALLSNQTTNVMSSKSSHQSSFHTKKATKTRNQDSAVKSSVTADSAAINKPNSEPQSAYIQVLEKMKGRLVNHHQKQHLKQSTKDQ